jgi:tetratricopeptide (TPR) repeat protein
MTTSNRLNYLPLSIIKKPAIFILLFCIHLPVIAVPSQDQLAAEANNAYQHSQFQKSIDIYNKVINNGFESASLYYNLGNAYYKLKDYTSAVYYYEKALKLAPGNSDIRFNLMLANNNIPDKIEQIPELFFKRWWTTLSGAFNLDQFAYGIIALLLLSLILFGVYLVSVKLVVKKTAFWAGTVMLLFTLFVFFSSLAKHNLLINHPEAIIFTPTVSVKSSPDPASTDLFVIHEGIKVELLDSIGDWNEIKIANGSRGWVMKADFRKI